MGLNRCLFWIIPMKYNNLDISTIVKKCNIVYYATRLQFFINEFYFLLK